MITLWPKTVYTDLNIEKKMTWVNMTEDYGKEFKHWTFNIFDVQSSMRDSVNTWICMWRNELIYILILYSMFTRYKVPLLNLLPQLSQNFPKNAKWFLKIIKYWIYICRIINAHLRSSLVFSGVCVIVFLFVLLSFFLWSLCCLFFDLQILNPFGIIKLYLYVLQFNSN